ncbi:hypothetical protein JOB18_022957 [Solea senegalensis]|uniref:Uncharacterized protein n=1 Tax=Solea senegalensis TaxID=28829 RepID=A0AAV6SZD2_SOLSE|nr:hypothetical protein JOB18_022957 [Solea senegalensis]
MAQRPIKTQCEKELEEHIRHTVQYCLALVERIKFMLSGILASFISCHTERFEMNTNVLNTDPSGVTR